jgi:hypothetical protein
VASLGRSGGFGVWFSVGLVRDGILPVIGWNDLRFDPGVVSKKAQ